MSLLRIHLHTFLDLASMDSNKYLWCLIRSKLREAQLVIWTVPWTTETSITVTEERICKAISVTLEIEGEQHSITQQVLSIWLTRSRCRAIKTRRTKVIETETLSNQAITTMRLSLWVLLDSMIAFHLILPIKVQKWLHFKRKD